MVRPCLARVDLRQQYERIARLKLLMSVSIGLILAAQPAAAIETCRFIEAKPEREACYHRQELELAAKRKPVAKPEASTRSNEAKTFESLQQMRRDDEEVYRSIRGICNGC
ncbi:hypothetical protein ACVMB0_001130 [Bradyrhizobium sp. USDA 4451]